MQPQSSRLKCVLSGTDSFIFLIGSDRPSFLTSTVGFPHDYLNLKHAYITEHISETTDFNPEDRGGMLLRIITIPLQDYAMLQPRGPQPELGFGLPVLQLND
jgi:hypothetical protein